MQNIKKKKLTSKIFQKVQRIGNTNSNGNDVSVTDINDLLEKRKKESEEKENQMDGIMDKTIPQCLFFRRVAFF